MENRVVVSKWGILSTGRAGQYLVSCGIVLLFLAALSHASSSHAAGLSPGGLALDTQRNLAFVADGNSVEIVSIASVADPALVSSSIVVDDIIQDLYYDASRAVLFVAAESSGLVAVDVSSPDQPTVISTLPVYYFGALAPVRAVTVAGNFAYVAANFGGVHSIDISDLSNPQQAFFTLLGGAPTSDVHIDGGLLYVAGARLSRFALDTSGGFQSAGQNYAAASRVVSADGDRIFVTPASTVAAFQIHGTGSGLPFLSSTDYAGSNVRDLTGAGDFLYLADPIVGFGTYDIADPTSPEFVSLLAEVTSVRVIVEAGYAYLDTHQGLEIIDISDPENPVSVGQSGAGGEGESVPIVTGWGHVFLVVGLLFAGAALAVRRCDARNA